MVGTLGTPPLPGVRAPFPLVCAIFPCVRSLFLFEWIVFPYMGGLSLWSQPFWLELKKKKTSLFGLSPFGWHKKDKKKMKKDGSEGS